MGQLVKAKPVLSRRPAPRRVDTRDNGNIRDAVNSVKATQSVQTIDSPVMVRHRTYTAVGPKSHGRGGISYVYDDESHSQRRSCWSQNVLT